MVLAWCARQVSPHVVSWFDSDATYSLVRVPRLLFHVLLSAPGSAPKRFTMLVPLFRLRPLPLRVLVRSTNHLAPPVPAPPPLSFSSSPHFCFANYLLFGRSGSCLGIPVHTPLRRRSKIFEVWLTKPSRILILVAAVFAPLNPALACAPTSRSFWLRQASSKAPTFRCSDLRVRPSCFVHSSRTLNR